MISLNVKIPYFSSDVLTSALETALPGKVIGVSDYGRERTSTIWLDESASQADQQQALAIVQAHDPVTISVDKPVISANGTDMATFTVSAQRPDAAPIVLIATEPNGTQVPQPIALVNGVGILQLTATITGLYSVSLQNPVNRCVDTMTVTAQ